MLHTFLCTVTKQWLQAHVEQYIEADPVTLHGKRWSFRVTLLPAGADGNSEQAQLKMNLIGPGSVVLCAVRIMARPPHHDIGGPRFGICGSESMSWCFEVDDLLDEENPFMFDDLGSNEQQKVRIEAEVVKIIPQNCTSDDLRVDAFPINLSFTLRQHALNAKYFGKQQIFGDPVFACGCAWYIACQRNIDEGDDVIDFCIVTRPLPFLRDVHFNEFRCYGAGDFCDGRREVDIFISKPKPGEESRTILLYIEAKPSSFNSPLRDEAGDVTVHIEINKCERTSATPSSHVLLNEQGGLLQIVVNRCPFASASNLGYYNNPEQVYPNFTIPKGLALIINNYKFARGVRRGSEVDEYNIRQLLMKLGYNVLTTCKDRTAEQTITCMAWDRRMLELSGKYLQQMMEHAKQFAEDPAHGYCDSCIVVVLTHGNYRTLDGVNDKSVSVDEFASCFHADQARALAGKPKIFIFQACQGDSKRSFPGVPVLSTDGPSSSMMGKVIPASSDVFFAYATPPGDVSWRHPTKGSWFIRTVCEVFSSHAYNTSITDMMTKVNDVVGDKYKAKAEGYRQCTHFENRLRREFYFFPGVTSE